MVGAAEYAPLLLLSLFAGVWVDRMPRRRLLLASDVGQAVLIGSIPILFLQGLLHIEYLYGVAFLAGCFAVIFGIAYQAYLPELVSTEHLVEGNSKLAASEAIAEVAGPSIAGIILQILSAPLALFVDAASFLVSAICLTWIGKRPDPPVIRQQQSSPSIWKQIFEGLQRISQHPQLRAIAGCSSTLNFCETAILTVYTLYVINELHLSAVLLGLVLGIGSIGGLAGALLADRCTRRYGLGPVLLMSILLSGVGTVLAPLAHGPLFITVPLLIAGRFMIGFATSIYNINQISLRQITTPQSLQGRVNATIRFLAGGSVPLGALVGGASGMVIGARATILLGAIGITLSFCWLFFSPVRHLRKSLR
ncbi:MFS transporter [Dictyobacter vulcani]|uniref:MFS transporter n=1 Tax=Dictyobacter vulcani TaxID=2607529 RepID=A0A5J4KQX1_9CHLR|nr:MFS transporter [Dictyobacter vulcani]GER90003.1 MFS transporter [Dictyobacter vulcani]